MTQLKLNARVTYIRDAHKFSETDRVRLTLSEALQAAIANHKPDETPVIIASKLQLIGIDAIRALRNVDGFLRD